MTGSVEEERGDSSRIQDQTRTQDEQWERQRHEEVISAIHSITNELNTESETQDAEEKKKASREKATIVLLLLTFVAAGGGDCIFYATMRDARIAADTQHRDATKQMVVSVRPWVGLTDDSVPVRTTPLTIDDKGNAWIDHAITFKNYSSSAAQNVMSFGMLLITEDLKAIASAQDTACGEGYVGKKDMGAVVFPGKNWLTEVSGSSVAKRDMTSPGYDKKFEAWFVGCIGYRDQFDVLYLTKFKYWLVDEHNKPVTFFPNPGTVVRGTFVEYDSSIE